MKFNRRANSTVPPQQCMQIHLKLIYVMRHGDSSEMSFAPNYLYICMRVCICEHSYKRTFFYIHTYFIVYILLSLLCNCWLLIVASTMPLSCSRKRSSAISKIIIYITIAAAKWQYTYMHTYVPARVRL